MLRNRFPKFPKMGRNLHNLHVIPTASASVLNLELKEPNPAVIQITPSDDSNNSPNFFNKKEQIPPYKNRFNKRRRSKRQRKRGKNYFPANQPFAQDNDYQWYNLNYIDPVAEKETDPVAKKETDPVAKKETDPVAEKVESPSDAPGEENYFEEVEVASVEAEAKQEVLVGFRKSKPFYLKYKKNGHFKPKIYKLADTTYVNCLNVQEDVDVDIVSEAEYEYETDNLERSDSQEVLNMIVEIDDSGNDSEQAEEKAALLNDDKASESTQRIYKTCINGNDDFTQGKSLIQSSLDSWKSHLIGLEYLVEILNASKDLAERYCCELCCEDLKMQDFPAICVINHINSCKHVVKYLEKHFPGYGYKFAENSDYNSADLQKLAEEINQRSGYYFMCITSIDYYIENDESIKEIIENAYHPNGNDSELNENLLSKKVESSVSEEVVNIVSDIIEKVVPSEAVAKTSEVDVNTSIPKSVPSDLQVSVPSADSVKVVKDKDYKMSVNNSLPSKNKEKKPKNSLTCYKGTSALSSYMKLRSFATVALRKPAKKLPSVTKKVCDENENLKKRKTIKTENVNVTEEESDEIVNVTEEESDEIETEIVSVIEKELDEIETDIMNVTEDEIEIVNVIEKKLVETLNIDHEDDYENAASSKIGSETAQKAKEKVPLKTSTVHSKYCRKRILGKESSRLKLSAKASAKDEFVSGVSNKSSVKNKSVTVSVRHGTPKKITEKNKSVTVSVNHGTPKKITDKNKSATVSVSHGTPKKITEKNKEESRHVKTIKNSSQKRSPSQKITSVKKTSVKSKSPVAVHSSSRVIHKKSYENSSTDQINVLKNSPSLWKPITRTSKSPMKSSTSNSTHLLKSSGRKQSRSPGRMQSRSPGRKQSRSPGKKQSRSPTRKNVKRHSKSPTKRIKSPLRPVIKPSFSPAGKHSRSPAKKHSRSPFRRKSSPGRRKSKSPVRRKSSPGNKKSRSPARRKSRSPVRRKSRSPVRRKSRSPIRRKSRSPVRRKSRSPIRRKSRSPLRRHSRSPLRQRARSPLKQRSRSPLRRRSRSPLRQRSRSPLRQRSRSPLRQRSRSPLRRRSRSPIRRYSRSPMRQRSRSPLRRHSRSPLRHLSRSPLRRHSRSPFRRHSRSPLRRHSRSPDERRSRSPVRRHSRSPLQKSSDKYRSLYKVHSPNFGLSVHERFDSEERFSSSAYNYDKRLGTASELSKIRETSKMLSPPHRNTLNTFKSHLFPHISARGISDLDPVSDEDESLYFNDKQPCAEDNISPSSKMMLAKLLQKFSMADVNPNDPSLNKLMQFMEAHSAEIQDLVGSQSKPGNINVAKVDSNLQERSLFLQQYILSNLAGSNPEPRLPTPAPNMPSKFVRPPFLQGVPAFGHPTNMPPPNVPQPIQQRFFPPNVNVPPPQLFPQLNQPHQDFTPKPIVPPEVMFKDLKATVNKIFGAMKQKPKMPGYVTEPDPEKWDLNHPDTPKFNVSVGAKNVFHPQGKNIEFSHVPQNPVIREEIPMFNNNNPAPGQFFGGAVNRPQIPSVPVPPPDAKVSFCDVSRGSSKGNLFPVVNVHANPNFNAPSTRGDVNDVKMSLAQRLASVLIKVGMVDVPAPLLQEMLMKIGAFSSSPRQDISEAEILSILKRLGYLT